VSPGRGALAAPAKVNLRLRVLEKRGAYHELETLFLAVGLADEVEVEPGGEGVHLEVEGGGALGPPGDNLVVRAARAHQRESGGVGGLRLRLVKRVPSAAGLGGGSADAAATLRLLDALLPRPLGVERLRAIALELGSDVPFFLCGSPYALARGRGELLEPLPPLPPRPLLIAHPGVELPTGAAFAELAALRQGAAPPRPAALFRSELEGWEGAAALAVNDFEEVAVRRVPRIASALEELSAAGAVIARLSGSGAAVFGVFGEGEAGRADRTTAAAALRARGWDVQETENLAAMPSPRVDPPSETP
jgi:4-diphosphocytidyl-2-C-methyl-D-erythritol kinase